LALAHPANPHDETDPAREAVAVVLDDMAKHRPELEFTGNTA
jgi:hypothetical protein